MSIPTIGTRIEAARSRLVELEGLARLVGAAESERATSDPVELSELLLATIAKLDDQLFHFQYLPSEVQKTLVPNDDERDELDRQAREVEP